MTEYIKKMSQDNLILKRKNGELERNNKNLEDTCKKLKRNMFEKGILVDSHTFRRDVDVVSSHNIRHDEEEEYLNISKSSLLSSCTAKRTTMMTNKGLPERLLPSSLNFKKKLLGKSQERP